MLSSSNSNLLIVIYYVEAGCLGLKGEHLIDDFCDFMSKKINHVSNNFCIWNIQPLTNMHKPHIEYHIKQKKLSSEQARLFLLSHDKQINQFEDHIDDLVIHFIEDYLGR